MTTGVLFTLFASAYSETFRHKITAKRVGLLAAIWVVGFLMQASYGDLASAITLTTVGMIMGLSSVDLGSLEFSQGSQVSRYFRLGCATFAALQLYFVSVGQTPLVWIGLTLLGVVLFVLYRFFLGKYPEKRAPERLQNARNVLAVAIAVVVATGTWLVGPPLAVLITSWRA